MSEQINTIVAPSTDIGVDTLAKAVADMNATVAVLQEALTLLTEKARQLANHERLMGTIKDPGHIKVGTGFERTADGTVNVIGTAAFEGIMEAHDANAAAHGISVPAEPNSVVRRDENGNILGNIIGTARYA